MKPSTVLFRSKTAKKRVYVVEDEDEENENNDQEGDEKPKIAFRTARLAA